ncbi:Ig-like domain-containing protein, partial [Pseudoxanthomonas sp. F11]|uniref:Ig-like domain-containing protein n=1 Tax=Pseudoxanthomonas sp. F11 TaxID=3126308 RepID=UPI00300D0072
MAIQQGLEGYSVVELAAGGVVAAVDGRREAFVISADRADVGNYAREGNDLLVVFKDGSQIRIANFFSASSDGDVLIFRHGGEAFRVDFGDALTAAGDGVNDSLVRYIALGNYESALYGLLGLVGGLGAVAALLGGGSEHESEPAPRTPAVPSVSSILDDVGSRTGPLATGQATDDRRPTFTGTGDAGATITLRDASGTVLGTAIVGADGRWSLTPTSNLPDGLNNLQLVQTNAAGSSSPISVTVTVDTTPPATPPAPAGYADDAGAVQNPNSTASSSDDSTPGINIGPGLTD